MQVEAAVADLAAVGLEALAAGALEVLVVMERQEQQIRAAAAVAVAAQVTVAPAVPAS
jgi:hypothetical protein